MGAFADHEDHEAEAAEAEEAEEEAVPCTVGEDEGAHPHPVERGSVAAAAAAAAAAASPPAAAAAPRSMLTAMSRLPAMPSPPGGADAVGMSSSQRAGAGATARHGSVAPPRCRSPRHRLPLDSKNEG
jgi:hypothetical protein